MHEHTENVVVKKLKRKTTNSLLQRILGRFDIINIPSILIYLWENFSKARISVIQNKMMGHLVADLQNTPTANETISFYTKANAKWRQCKQLVKIL